VLAEEIFFFDKEVSCTQEVKKYEERADAVEKA